MLSAAFTRVSVEEGNMAVDMNFMYCPFVLLPSSDSESEGVEGGPISESDARAYT